MLPSAVMTAFRSRYQREVGERLRRPAVSSVVTEAELRALPSLLQTYLKRVGVVGRPHVRDYRMRWTGRMRQSRDARWMPLTAEQHNFTDPPERFFLMRASMFGLPVEGLHRFADGAATMQVRAAWLFEVANGSGEKMNQSESVTLFNDLCAFAPAALINAPVDWRETGPHTLEGRFHHLGNTVAAQLLFDLEGDLVNFISHDRYQSRDGRTWQAFGWETPLSNYQQLGPARVATKGEARWQEPSGTWTYAELSLAELEYRP